MKKVPKKWKKKNNIFWDYGQCKIGQKSWKKGKLKKGGKFKIFAENIENGPKRWKKWKNKKKWKKNSPKNEKEKDFILRLRSPPNKAKIEKLKKDGKNWKFLEKNNENVPKGPKQSKK